MGNMGSAHPLVEVNVSFKFEGNPSISKGYRADKIWRRTDRPTDATKRIQYSPPTFCGGGIKTQVNNFCLFFNNSDLDPTGPQSKFALKLPTNNF